MGHKEVGRTAMPGLAIHKPQTVLQNVERWERCPDTFRWRPATLVERFLSVM